MARRAWRDVEGGPGREILCPAVLVAHAERTAQDDAVVVGQTGRLEAGPGQVAGRQIDGDEHHRPEQRVAREHAGPVDRLEFLRRDTHVRCPRVSRAGALRPDHGGLR